ncbi:mitochondria fission 1 protein [Umbelopsis sp. PMI_123]|nr:mitochondria fission 1 protein [Umbelopsis sp. PMI_123]
MATDSIPFAADAETPLPPESLEVLRKQYMREGEYATIQTKFNYAWGLIKCKRTIDIEKGVRLLTEIYQQAPERRRECLYYLALGHYKMSNYIEAKKFNQQLLVHEPKNSQAIELNKLIDEKVSREGVIGLAIVGSIAAVGAMVVASLVRKSSK